MAMDAVPALRDVRCFVAVAEHGSFSRAAADLGLSQPAVSQAIARLEQLLDCRLFHRTSRRVHPTPAGHALLAPAHALLTEAATFTATARDLATKPPQPITFAYPPLLGPFVARIARRLARRDPNLTLDLCPLPRRAAAEALATGTATAAVLAAPLPHIDPAAPRPAPGEVPGGSRLAVTGGRAGTAGGLVSVPLVSVGVGQLAVPTGDALAGAGIVGVEALGRRRVLVPGERPAGGPFARLVGALPAGCARVVAEEIDDWGAALDLVAAGLGVLPVPNLVAGSVRRPDVRFVALEVPAGRRTDRVGLQYRLAWWADAETARPADLGGPDEPVTSVGTDRPGLLALVTSAQEVLRTH
jgi:DNA-binding transcriptional LysR family regulator